MPDFVPFDRFLDRLDAARPEGLEQALIRGVAPRMGTAPPSQVRDFARAEFDVIKSHLLDVYGNAKVSNSFLDADGLHVDCISVETQPGIQAAAEDEPHEPPAFVEMPEADTGRRRRAEPPQLAQGRRDASGNDLLCPEGFVPVVRTSMERVATAGSLATLFAKAPDGGRHPLEGSASGQLTPIPLPGGIVPPAQSSGGVIHAYAHAAQRVSNIGGRSWLNLWNPNPAPGVFSLSQQWFAGGSGANLQTVEGGWHVYPQLHGGSPLTRLFIYFTADGYRSTGSYNLDRRQNQGGFIQTSNNWVIGGSFQASTMNGEQRGFLMQWQRNQTGDWWLFMQGGGDPEPVGYYPRALFGGGQMANFAETIDFGGEVCSQQNVRDTGPMGSGQPASSGFQRAAFQKLCAYLDPQTNTMAAPSLLQVQQDAPCYTITPPQTGSTDWGVHFFFGGASCRF